VAISALTTWELRPSGGGSADTNGGGYVTGTAGLDFSQLDPPFDTGTNLTVDAVTNTDVTPDAHAASSDDVGNIIQITGGAGFTTGFYEILSIQGGTKWRLDRSPAATGTSGGTWALGGALASPGKTGGAMVAGNKAYQKAGTYTVTSATPNIAGGCVTMPAGASAANTSKWFGYQTTRGDGGTKPIIKADGVITTFTLLTTGTNNHVENVEVDGNSRTSSRGFFAGSTNSRFYRCTAKNCTNNGFSANTGNNWAVHCDATGCATQPVFANLSCKYCVAYNNSVNAFSSVSGTIWESCFALNTTGVGFTVVGSGTSGSHCTANACSTAGFSRTAAAGVSSLMNCLAANSGAYGYTGNAADDNFYLYNCAGYNNTSGNVNSSVIPAAQQIGFVALSANPFNNAAGGDFSLNMTAGGGNDARQGGIPGAFPGVSTTGYPDIGAVQEGGVRIADITAIQSGLATQASVNTIDDFLDTELATILAAVDTEIAAIKAKTDNLPSDPADASDIGALLTFIDDFVDTEVAAIKVKTDSLPADPADASDIAALIAAIPAGGGPSLS
jgi:hypothetical protein